ncbi:MAG: M23 family metallopeptidase [Lachnospiraceae bacterium]|nr:M23 family metallopeptidase [Lachnospiraceae bacterium]MDE7000183.1 M23 family metallopeptidase [Lachnospiraceae bacterium]
MNRRNNKRPALQKEKISIIAASVFVLSALTLAGVYMSSQGDRQKEENRIDFAKLEQENITSEEGGNTALPDTRYVSGKAESDIETNRKPQTDSRFIDPDIYDLSDNNDMDVDPAFTEANSGQVENTVQENTTAGTDKAAVFMEGQEQGQEQELVADTPLNFSDEDSLALPIIGDVLLDYSMDKAVYHTTMQQYRYNPSLVVAASEGQDITAAADGIVSDVYYDSQTGNTIRFDLGNGYMLTYGQLDSIALNPGDRVSAGDIVGKVAKPTIYYTEEGTNIYYKLTKDGKPVDPLHRSSGEEQ